MPGTISTIADRIGLLISTLRTSCGPRWGTIFVTRRCDLRCSYCFVPLHTSRDITADHWFRIIDRMAEWGVRVVTVVGGEPTLRTDLEDILRHMARRGLYVFLHSNCRLLTEQRIDDLKEAGVFALTGSLDSINGFEKSDQRVLDVLDYARRAGIVPIVSSVLTSKNLEGLPALARLANSRGIFFNFGLYQSVGGLFSKRADSLIPPREGLFRIVAQLKAMKRSGGGIRTSDTFTEPANLERYYSGWKCDPLADHWLVVNNDGFLMRCQEFASDIDPLRLDSLKDAVWVAHKVATVHACRGCYHHCYFDAEQLRGKGLLGEWQSLLRNTVFELRQKRRMGGASPVEHHRCGVTTNQEG